MWVAAGERGVRSTHKFNTSKFGAHAVMGHTTSEEVEDEQAELELKRIQPSVGQKVEFC